VPATAMEAPKRSPVEGVGDWRVRSSEPSPRLKCLTMPSDGMPRRGSVLKKETARVPGVLRSRSRL
jgi:hypothetical protein